MSEEKLHNRPQVKNVSELMASIEEEIALAKSGDLGESKARVVARMRSNQTKLVEIALQAARLDASLKGDLKRRLGPVGPVVDAFPDKPELPPTDGT